MTDLTIRQDQHLAVPATGQPGTAALAQWAQAADAAYRLADGLCSTQFAPATYKGKPQEAAAAILAGAEVGLSPLASLRAFDNIQGTPAPKAITLRAIAQGLGHDVRIEESTPVLAVVSGRRKGDTEWQTSTWSIERAQQMGLTSKSQWKQQPAAMLVARATAEVCRWIASDAIMGMPYTAEEIRDQGPTIEGRPAPRHVTAAEILGHTDHDDVPAPAEHESLITADDILHEIRDAATQSRLDEIRALCQELGIRDPQVRDAWSARSAQLAEVA